MCGIAGIVDFAALPDTGALNAMLKAMVHRGPDDEGVLVEGPVAMGMRRLSIIDLAGGHQPIFNEDGTVAVVFNGEIYNYIELRNELVAKGHAFATHTDTEVLVHLYEEHGPGFVKRLNGMFGIALWDKARNRFLLARDHVGIKPLYWRWIGETLWFASELKCFKAAGCRPWEVDRDAISMYLHLGYIPRGHAPIRQVNKLLPGQMILMEAGRAPRCEKYWRLSDHVGNEPADDATCRELAELLDDAIQLQLRSDVPLGTFLSGGLDSSAITAMAARKLPHIASFGIGFHGHHFDETPFARMVAGHVGSDHHEQFVDPGMLPDLIEKLAWFLDEPNADPAMLPSYMVCKYSRERVKVALSGAGGDELFAGYPRHLDPVPGSSKAGMIRAWLPAALRRSLFRPFAALHPGIGRLAFSNNAIGMGYWTDLADAAALRGVAPWAESFSTLDWIESIFAEVRHTDPVNQRCYYDATTYLPDQILSMTDRASMAVSLEVRVPLLDIRLVEKMAGISGKAKIADGAKTQLKTIANPYLPPDILTRRKIGFALPVVKWMGSGPVGELLRQLPSGRLAADGWIEASVLKAMAGNQSAVEKNAFFLWNLIMLELWYRQYG